ncbi:unnamed protein product, partial [Taenia asiatica]|uniref:DUF5726 domain-containing protein n=1 Tax=Taenia asiatica TaxID=60517 RepID=A0A0R3WGV8_TAEAS
MNFEDWIKTAREFRCSSTLFLAAINAGVTADSDVNHCCEIPSQLAIDQRERSLAREFFQRDQKMGENDEECAWNLQLLAERTLRGCPPARVTNWVAVQFCVGVRPPTIAAKLNAMKTNDLNQLVEVATRKRQELLLTSAPQTAQRRQNPPRPRWIPSRQTPRADSGAVTTLVNPKAFPDLFRKFRARPSSIELLSAEGRKVTAIGEMPLNDTVEKETWTVPFIICPELVWDVILGADLLRKTGAIRNFAEGPQAWCSFAHSGGISHLSNRISQFRVYLVSPYTTSKQKAKDVLPSCQSARSQDYTLQSCHEPHSAPLQCISSSSPLDLLTTNITNATDFS